MSNTVVRTNVMSLNSHRNLGMVGTQQNRASQRLSSGFRINSAADDAAGLGISEKMRSQIRGLDQASRNAQDGISLIQTAEGAMSTINEMVTRIRELVIQAANDTNVHDDTNDASKAQSDRIRIQDEINQLMDEIDATATRTEFNTRTLLDGSLAAARFVTNEGDASIIEGVGAWLNDLGVFDAQQRNFLNDLITKNFGNQLTTAMVNASLNAVGFGVVAGLSGIVGLFTAGQTTMATAVTLGDVAKALGIVFVADSTNVNYIEGLTGALQALASAINAATANTAIRNGQLPINWNGETGAIGTTAAFDSITVGYVGTTGMAALREALGLTAGQLGNNTQLQALFTDSVRASLDLAAFGGRMLRPQGLFGPGNNSAGFSSAASFTTWFNARFGSAAVVGGHLTQSAQNLIGNSGVVVIPPGESRQVNQGGVPLWFHIGANHNQGININIQAVGTRELSAIGVNGAVDNFTFDRLRTKASGNILHPMGQAPTFDANGGVLNKSGQEIQKFIDAIDLALAHVTGERSKLGAVQNRLEYTIENLNISSENLSAANSRIRDADMAKEMMRLTQSNVLQQAAISMLAQANQAPQSVLQLLG